MRVAIIIFIISQCFMVNFRNFDTKDIATHKFVKETMSKPVILTECDNGDDRCVYRWCLA